MRALVLIVGAHVRGWQAVGRVRIWTAELIVETHPCVIQNRAAHAVVIPTTSEGAQLASTPTTWIGEDPVLTGTTTGVSSDPLPIGAHIAETANVKVVSRAGPLAYFAAADETLATVALRVYLKRAAPTVLGAAGVGWRQCRLERRVRRRRWCGGLQGARKSAASGIGVVTNDRPGDRDAAQTEQPFEEGAATGGRCN